MQYDLRKPALSVCGALPVTGAVGMTPSDLAAAVCEAHGLGDDAKGALAATLLHLHVRGAPLAVDRAAL